MTIAPPAGGRALYCPCGTNWAALFGPRPFTDHAACILARLGIDRGSLRVVRRNHRRRAGVGRGPTMTTDDRSTMTDHPRRQLLAGETVTYHADAGDTEAILLRFNGVGNASLSYGDVWLENVREGPDAGQWDAIPPRPQRPAVPTEPTDPTTGERT